MITTTPLIKSNMGTSRRKTPWDHLTAASSISFPSFEDGTHTVFLNAEGGCDTISQELKCLVNCFRSGVVSDEFTKKHGQCCSQY